MDDCEMLDVTVNPSVLVLGVPIGPPNLFSGSQNDEDSSQLLSLSPTMESFICRDRSPSVAFSELLDFDGWKNFLAEDSDAASSTTSLTKPNLDKTSSNDSSQAVMSDKLPTPVAPLAGNSEEQVTGSALEAEPDLACSFPLSRTASTCQSGGVVGQELENGSIKGSCDNETKSPETGFVAKSYDSCEIIYEFKINPRVGRPCVKSTTEIQIGNVNATKYDSAIPEVERCSSPKQLHTDTSLNTKAGWATCTRCQKWLPTDEQPFVRRCCGHVFCIKCVSSSEKGVYSLLVDDDVFMDCEDSTCRSSIAADAYPIDVNLYCNTCGRQKPSLIYRCVLCDVYLYCVECTPYKEWPVCTKCSVKEFVTCAILNLKEYPSGINRFISHIVGRRMGNTGWIDREYLVRWLGQHEDNDKWVSIHKIVREDLQSVALATLGYDYAYPLTEQETKQLWLDASENGA